MRLRAVVATRASLQGKLKLARLLQMPEKAFEDRVRELESQDLFRRLVGLGVVSMPAYENARFAFRRFGGFELRASAEGLGDLLDGQGELVSLISRVGQEAFEELFLRGEALTDAERAKACGISAGEARQLRALVDRLYVQEELQGPAASAAAPPAFSVVAGVEIEGGLPVLGFFNREIWKGRYRIDERKKSQLLATLGRAESARVERLLAELEFVERRKTTLYRLLGELLAVQGDFLASGDPGRRRPLTQKTVAARLGVVPSVLNRLISNKSVQLPWGTQAPLKAFMPSRKSLLRERLYELAAATALSDEGLREELFKRYGERLSRRSIAQYRKELGLGPMSARESA